MVVAVLHPRHPRGLRDALRSIPDLDLSLPDTPEGVLAALREGAPALITYDWDDRWLDTGLEWVQAVSAGVEQFPIRKLQARGIRLTSAGGVHAPTVAEHALALLLALTRMVGPASRDAVAHRWRYRSAYELSGLTIGILGLGAIGEEIARRAAGLGMRPIGSRRHPERYFGVAERVYGPDEALLLCREADVVVAVLPDTPETRGLLGPEELEAIGPGWFINVGRGSVVDEQALIEALTDGPLRGAGLDVFVTEPLPEDSPLWDLENVVITPHSAWISERLPQRLADLIGRNVAAYSGRGDWVNLVDG